MPTQALMEAQPQMAPTQQEETQMDELRDVEGRLGSKF
jgi:hypothetical protein